MERGHVQPVPGSVPEGVGGGDEGKRWCLRACDIYNPLSSRLSLRCSDSKWLHLQPSDNSISQPKCIRKLEHLPWTSHFLVFYLIVFQNFPLFLVQVVVGSWSLLLSVLLGWQREQKENQCAKSYHCIQLQALYLMTRRVKLLWTNHSETRWVKCECVHTQAQNVMFC